MEQKKVLFITSSLDGGGAEEHILNLCKYLKSISVATDLITISPEKGKLENKFHKEKVPVRYFPLSSLKELLLPWRLLALRKLIREIKPDIIHAHLFHGEVAGAAASFFTDAPFIATRHCSGVEFEGFRMTIMRMMRRRIDFVIAVSEEAVNESLKGGHAMEKMSMIPSGIDTDIFVPLGVEEKKKEKSIWLKKIFNGNANGDEIVVGTLAAMRKVKNQSLFLKIARRVADSPGDGRHVRFVIFGDGPERKNLESLHAGLHLDGIVSMPGFTREPWKTLPLFDIFLLPSLIEGTPLALLEAMSCGVPCIASDVGDVGTALSGAGIVLESEDEEGFFKQVLSLIDDPQKRLLLGRQARSRVEKDYDIAPWGERIKEIYEAVLGENRSDKRRTLMLRSKKDQITGNFPK
ncbi:MAG: glycosyltransferase [Candidatus Krumholzibacteriota bacterium]|nr:glycosyltransferase [Candidatus Krumholzibacteriota bacterium]